MNYSLDSLKGLYNVGFRGLNSLKGFCRGSQREYYRGLLKGILRV